MTDKNTGGRPKVLFLSQRFLFPMDTGGKIRSGNILAQLKGRFSVTVISNVEHAKDGSRIEQMSKLCDKFIPVPWVEVERFTKAFYWKILRRSFSRYPISMLNDYSPQLERAVLDELAAGDYDLAICDFVQSGLNFKQVQNVPVLLFQHNVEATIAKRHLDRAKNPVAKLFWWLQYRRMFKHEGGMCQRFDGVIAVSDNDQARMEEWYGVNNVHTIPTGVDTDYYRPAEDVEEKRQLVFVGGMDWLPNEDAMFFFINEILPLIRAQAPDIKLTIVGKNPSPKFLNFAQDCADVEVTGWVTDTRPYIADSAAFIVPIRIGGGTRMKIYEGMAMAKAVVSTTVGAEGLPLSHGEQILFADEAQCFADQVLRLINDQDERARIGNNARTYVCENFRWKKIAEVFAGVCTTVMAGKGTAP